jgi:biotin transport system substrate-specific component
MLTNATYADVLRPYSKSYSAYYDFVLIVAGALLIALSARFAIVLPFSPVPVTGQTFAVLITGALLGARRGCLSVLLYITQGVLGLPVFSMGRAGFVTLLGPTGGYLVGFIAAAYIVGLLAEKGWDRKVVTTVLAMVIGSIVIYAFGVLWLYGFAGSVKVALALGLYPFILGDIFKIVLAAALLPTGWKLLEYRELVKRY